MKGIIFRCIVALIQILPGLTAQEDKPSLQLILSPGHITVTPDSKFDLNIKLVNHSSEVIMCGPNMWTSGVDEGYAYDIRSSDGYSVRRIPGKEKEKSSPYPHLGLCVVGPGGSVETSVGHVMSAFDMRRPGVYTVQVSRPDPNYPEHILGTSNIVTVTVKAPE